MRLDRIWIVSDRTPLTESVDELVSGVVLRGRVDDAVHLPHLILGCERGTWDREHWTAFSTLDEAREEAQRRWEGYAK